MPNGERLYGWERPRQYPVRLIQQLLERVLVMPGVRITNSSPPQRQITRLLRQGFPQGERDGANVRVPAAVSESGIDTLEQIQVDDRQNLREGQGALGLYEGAAREAAGQCIEVGV